MWQSEYARDTGIGTCRRCIHRSRCIQVRVRSRYGYWNAVLFFASFSAFCQSTLAIRVLEHFIVFKSPFSFKSEYARDTGIGTAVCLCCPRLFMSEYARDTGIETVVIDSIFQSTVSQSTLVIRVLELIFTAHLFTNNSKSEYARDTGIETPPALRTSSRL